MNSSALIKKADERVGISKIVGVGLRDIIDAEIPANTVNLNLTDNKISDFVGFDENPNLETLILDKNPIFSFRGFPNYPNLKEISMVETPLSYLKNFRALCIIAAGKQLSVINGVSVTPNDITIALQYGELSETRNLIVRGWIPKRPSYTNDVKPAPLAQVERRTHNKTPQRGTNLMKSAVSPGTKKLVKKHDVEASQLKRVLAVLDAQENDPTSVRAVRVLRAIGYDREGIRSYLREFYSPRQEPKKPSRLQKTMKKQEIDPNSLEGQLARQNDTIQILAAKLNAIRFKNRNTNKYDAMLMEAAAPLIENAQFLADLQDNNEDDEDYYHFMSQTQQQQQSIQNSPTKSPRAKSKSIEEGERIDRQKKAEDSYIKLRLAVCEYLKTSPSMGDNILIQLLNDLMEEDKDENEEEEEEEEEGSTETEQQSESNKSSDSDIPVHYVQQPEDEEQNDEVPPFSEISESDNEPQKQNVNEEAPEKIEENPVHIEEHDIEDEEGDSNATPASPASPDTNSNNNTTNSTINSPVNSTINSTNTYIQEEEDEEEKGDSQLVVVIDKEESVNEEEEEEDSLEDVGIVLKTPVKN